MPPRRRCSKALTVVILCAPLALAACGSSNSHSSTVAAQATSSSSTSSSTTASTTTNASKAANPKRDAAATKHAKHSAAAHGTTSSTQSQPTPSTTNSTSTPASAPSHSNSGGSSSGGNSGGSASRPKAVQPLPKPVVSGSAGSLRASLHGESHAPTVGKKWHYSVLAVNASGQPVSGTVDTQFVFGGQVVGHEKPPTHPLKNGRLNDKVTFPPQSLGIQLTFQVVVHTPLGTVTLDWPVKSRR